MVKQFRLVFNSSRFLYSFVKELGGLNVFVKKITGIYKSQGIGGMRQKSRYILYQAGLNGGSGHGERPVINNRYQTLQCDLKKLKKGIHKLNSRPKFSIVMPTYNSNEEWLSEAIESIRNQIYDNWELCIADDASTVDECKDVLRKFAKKDKRIKIVFRKENGHISKASNSALELATGDYIVLLDHDDKLPEDALFWVAKMISDNPEAKLIYSDEDKFDLEGIRSDPYFKCDWNYSLFLSQNMISHLGVYKTEIVKKIGGFRKSFEGSQDYDLALRFIEQISPKDIFHIPRILYHWRTHPQSTAVGADKKPYALTAAQKAIDEHLKRKGINSSVDILPSQMYRVKYKLPDKKPLVSILIPTKNNYKLLKNCIKSIVGKTKYTNYEIIIINNNSNEENILKYLRRINSEPNVFVVTDNQEFNFSAINNKASEKAKGDFICFLNDDTEVISGEWLTEMMSIAIQKKVGAVGAKLWYPNNTLQHGGVILGIGGIGSHAHKKIPRGNGGYFNRANLIQEFSAVTAACMLVPKKLFEELGGFNENDLAIAFNDVDLCLRMREANYKIVWTPYAELYHHESISRGNDMQEDKKERFFKEIEYMKSKWGKWIVNDPAYSPNLTLTAENFTFAWPPRIDCF